MNPSTRSLTAALILALVSAEAAPTLAGETPAWTRGGLPVAAGVGDQVNPTLVSDGAGGAIIAWEDNRADAVGVCVQHLTSLGVPASGWSAPGILLSRARQPWIAGEGGHGAMVAWAVSSSINFRRIVNGEPFTEAGAEVIDFAAGVPRAEALPAEIMKVPHNELPFALPDGAGGVLLAWKRLSLSADKLMFQRLDASGAPATGWIYVRSNAGFYGEYDPSMCADGSGGAIFAWKGGYPATIMAQRMMSDGAVAPGWPASGAVVCAEPGNHRATGIVPDGAGGAIVVWRDGRGGSFEQIYAQRVTADGAIAAGWPAGGRAICTYAVDPGDSRFNGTYYEGSSPLAADGAGGAFIIWSDRRADGGDVYAQHLLPNGSLAAGWPENGLALCAAGGVQSRPAIVADGAGGAIACWEDARSGQADICAQRVTGGGLIGAAWPAEGLAVCEAAGDQRAPRLVSDGGAGAIIVWQDGRDGTADIYAAHVTADAVVPTLVSLVSAEGRPGLARLVWHSADALGTRATVERTEVAGEWTPLADLSTSGNGLITFEDRDVIAGHRYGYRLAIAEGSGLSLRGEVWLEIAESAGLSLGAPYPNPSPGEVHVPFLLPAGGGGTVELLDLSGRAVETRTLEAQGAGAHVVRLAAGRPLPPGLYTVRLSHAGSRLITRFAIVR